MRRLYKILFLFFLVNLNFNLAYSLNKVEESIITKTTVASPTAQITGNATVCKDAERPVITFTGSGGTAPYTFTYTITGVAGNQTITTTSGNSVTILASTANTGSFVYTLVSVAEGSNTPIAVTGQTATVVVNALPLISGKLNTCIGSTSNLNGSNSTTLWSSSNVSVATVNSSGVVTGVSAGTTNIDYTDNNGCVKTVMFTVNSLPLIDFTFGNNKCSGDPIQFNSTVSGVLPFTYLWDFGDGNTSTQVNPIHVFKAIGNSTQNFNVTLTVTSSITGCLKSITKSISVNQVPDSALDISNLNGGAFYDSTQNIFLNCSATASSPNFDFVAINVSSTKTTNTSYQINWGDGTIDNFSNSFTSHTHTYLVLGYFDITVTSIKADNSCSAPTVYKFFNGNAPKGNIDLVGDSSDCVPYTYTWPITPVTFGNPPGTTYIFSVNDGSAPQTFTQSTLPTSISHTFTKASCGLTDNKFTVTLKIENPCDSNSPTTQVQAREKPVALFDISPNDKVCTNNIVSFTNKSIGSYGNNCSPNYNTNWTIVPNTGWTISSGTLNSTDKVNIIFNTPGNYSIKLNIQQPGASVGRCTNDFIIKTICVESPLVPLFTLNTIEGCSPLNVSTTNPTNLTNICPGNPTYLWNVIYTGGYCGTALASWSYATGSATTSNPSFNLVTPGTYSIKLTMTNSCGSISTVAQTVIVKQPPTVTINPIASLCQVLPNTIVTPVAFVNSCAPLGGTLIYAWSFPGGSPSISSSPTPTVSYSLPGTYDANLSVTNECGTTVATKQTFTISSSPTITGTLFACAGQTSTLTGSVNPATTNPWTSSNTSVATINASGVVTAISAGTTTITYTNSIGCKNTALITVNPLPTITGTLKVCVGLTSTLIGSGTPATSNPWLSSNPAIATVSSAGVVTGIAAGTAIITYTNSNGCQKTATITVNLIPTVTVNSPVVCSGLSTTVIATPGIAGTYSYAWTVPSGFTNPGSVASFPTTIAGTYSVIITNTVTSCVSSIASGTVTANALPNLVITNPAALCSPLTVDITSPSITTGSDLGLTFTYWRNNTATISLSNPNAISASGTYYIKSLNANGCTLIKSVLVTVNPLPALPVVSPVSYCQNAVANVLTATALSNHTLNWYTVSTAGIPLGAAPTPSTAVVGTVNYYVSQTNTATGCEGNRALIAITTNALPTVSVNSPVVCSGLSATVTATPGAAGTYSYAWTVPAGFTNPGSVASFPTTIAGTYSVIITNSVTSCVSSSASGKVTANALPNLVITNPAAVCSPLTVDITSSSITTGSDLGLTLTYWTNSAATVALSNPSTITASGTYYIKGENANGCTLIKPVIVTVNSTPSIAAISNIIKCNNQSSGAINLTSTVAGTTFSWTNDTPSIGLAASGTGNIASFTTLNTGIIPVVASITVTPTANGCTGANQVFTITVNPTPTVNQPVNQEVCNGLLTAAISFTGNIPSTIYSWSNDKPSIGLALNGTGDIASFTAVNTSSAPIIATLTVTPSSNGCPGTPQTFTIKVNPSPAITFSPSPQTICSGDISALVTLNSTTTGVTFNWTTTQPAGISETLATSGSNIIPAQTLTNTTNADIIIKYVATATVAGGATCLGAIYNYAITVRPKPSITTPLAQTICSATAFSITPLDGSGNSIPTGTVYTWSAATISPAGAITGANAQNTPQSSISQTLVNGSDQTATATYTVTPKSGICSGTPFTVVITVNPSPKVVFSAPNQKICSGSDSTAINLSSPTTGNVTFDWTASIPTGITGATASGTTAVIPIQTLTNTTTNPLTIIYTATATITNGIVCQGQPNTYSITVNPAIVTSSILSNFNGFNVSTVGATDGSINVTVTGGSGVYDYSWSGPGGFSATTQDISNVPAGAYTLTIDDGLCSPVVLNFTLLAPMPMIIQEDLSAHKDIFCNGYLKGEIKVDITQESIGPYDFELTLQGGGIVASNINYAAVSYTFTGLKAGVYDIKVTDANGSVKTIDGVIITEPAGITASINSSTNVLCNGENTGSATVTASGGSGVLTYSWDTNPIQTTPTATGLTAGTYTVTITDANTCSTTKQVTITEPPILTTAISSQTNVLCFGNATGAATIVANGGTPPYTFSWNTSPVITTPTSSGLAAGSYDVTVTDANNCTKVQQVFITQPSGSLSSAIINSNDVSCFGGSNGSATVSVTNGTLPYTYSWNTTPIQTLATATGLAQGNYTVTITDFNGCTTSSSIVIAEPPAISTSITAQTNVACSGSNTGSATIVANGGTAPYIYSWDTNPVQTTATGINLAMGTYNVTVTDANNCATTQQVVITEPNGIVTSIAAQTNVDCFGKSTGSATIQATGGTAQLTYSWDTPIANTTPTANGLVAGTYQLTVTDANGCQKFQEVIITEPSDIIITTDLEKDITCFNAANGAIQITVTGGTPAYNYSWTRNGIPFSTVEDLSGLSPGVYEVTVSDTNSCGPKKAIFTITEPAVLDVTLMNQTNILCFGASTGIINVIVVGGTLPALGYVFAWTGPNGFTSTNQNLSAILAGTYTLTVTDDLGCTDELTVILTQPAEVVVTAQTTPIICYGDNNASIALTIAGGVSPYNVSWSNLASGTFQDNLSAGDYLITVTDALNCVKTLNVNIPEAPIFTVNPVVKNISCFGANNGSINLNLIGGIAPIKLTWSDGSVAGTSRNNLKPGTYSVTIIDSKPCTITRTFVILEPQLLALSANLTNAFDCDNANSGAINLLVSGGSTPFTYAWSNGAITEDLNNTPAGNYLVTVTDFNGCSKQAQYSIKRPPLIVPSVITKTDFDCETKYVKQSFVADVSGGVPPYQLLWSSGTQSGANNEIMNTNQNGIVVLNVIDAIGCKSNYTFNVSIPTLGSPSFDGISFAYSTFGMYSINDPIQFTNTATGDFVSVAWDFGDGTFSTELNPSHTFINSKEYVVTQTVTYPFGCVYVNKITFIVGKGYFLVVPTAFTPNSDTLNDTFRPVTKALKNVRLDVYDTWGSMIYSESGDILRGWDGKIKAINAENGNYYCKVSGETFYGAIVNESHPFVLIK